MNDNSIAENTQPETTRPAAAEGGQGQMDALLQRLASMETLLAAQAKSTKRVAASRTIMCLLMAALVLVFGIGLFTLNNTVREVTQEVPQLITNANTTLQQLDHTLAGVDIAGLNDAVGGIDEAVRALDIEALNGSVEELKKAVEALNDVMSIFGR